MALRVTDTNTRSLREFIPLAPPTVTMYHCGPTVYNFPHIGNLRAYVFADILRRTMEAHDFTVRQIINITDVGHLVSDADEGEDKMEVAKRREGGSVDAIIAKYSDAFFGDLAALNIKKAEDYPRATAHIPEQIALIQTLEAKGFTYATSDGIYFDTTKFPAYGAMARLDIKGLRVGARVTENEEKRNPTDFALWKFSPRDGRVREQEWDSPWGRGFPGWHIECSAMAMAALGTTLDIHTGGIDHIPVHHTNEIAQSEGATGQPFARYWMHSAHMMVDGEKMSKSLGNTYTLRDLEARGITPLAFRYFLLTAHYRTQINVTWEALQAAQKALTRLRAHTAALQGEGGTPSPLYLAAFMDALDDDLNTAKAIALCADILKDDTLSPAEKKATILAMDTVLALDLASGEREPIPEAVHTLVSEREAARAARDWTRADALRDQILTLGWNVHDTPEGQTLTKAVDVI